MDLRLMLQIRLRRRLVLCSCLLFVSVTGMLKVCLLGTAFFITTNSLNCLTISLHLPLLFAFFLKLGATMAPTYLLFRITLQLNQTLPLNVAELVLTSTTQRLLLLEKS